VLKYGGPFNPRDLYPYQLALFQIDSMRKDGRFIGVDGSIPEGQGIINANLSECHELVEMLKESMDEGETEDDDDDEYVSSSESEPADGRRRWYPSKRCFQSVLIQIDMDQFFNIKNVPLPLIWINIMSSPPLVCLPYAIVFHYILVQLVVVCNAIESK